MKNLNRIILAVTLFSALAFVNLSAQGFGAMPGTKCCITSIEKALDGFRNATMPNGLVCGDKKEKYGNAKYQFNIGTPWQCDEKSQLESNSKLTAEGAFTQRNIDGFAVFAGKFTIVSSTGALLFTGLIEIHERTPCANKATGWIEGKSPSGAVLRANLQLDILTNTPLASPDVKFKGTLFGAQIISI